MRAAVAGLALLMLALAPAAPLVGAHAPGEPLPINFTKTFPGADTYMFSIRSPVSFNILDDSFFRVTASFYVNESRQDVGALIGVRRFINGACPTPNGDDPCIFRSESVSIKDITDFTVDEDTTNTHFVNDPDAVAFGQEVAYEPLEVWWDGVNAFQKEDPADPFVTFRYFATIPGARSITVQVHIHSRQAISVREEVAHNGGFFRVAEDYAPPRLVDSWAAEVATGGEHTVTVPAAAPPVYLYAIEAPSWYGWTASPTLAGMHNTAALSSFGVELPNGDTKTALAPAIGSEGDFVAIYGSATAGTYRFFNNVHAGVGPQDLYTVGFVGPVAG